MTLPQYRTMALVLLSFLFCGPQLSAQFGRVSPKAGVAISHIDNMTGDGFGIKGRSGFTIGADWRVEGIRTFAQPGLYIQHVNTRLYDPGNSIAEENSRITSVKAPLTVGWYVNGRRRLVVVHARTGFVPEVILGTKPSDNFGYNKDLINTFQLNGMLGIGVDLAIFTIDLSHEVGILSILKDDNLYNRVTVLTFGLIF